MPIFEDLDGVIDDFAVPGGIEVEQASSTGPDVWGNPSPGVLQRFTVDPAIVQPASPRELQRLPEGDRTRETILVHTKRRLRTALESRGLGPSVVIYRPGGDSEAMRYVVTSAGDWSIVGGFYACLAVREELD